MEYEDHVRIATPEGVELELTLAGVGSRFTSALIDFMVQIALLIALALSFYAAGALDGWGSAAFTGCGFLLFAGYDILFEVFASGRTPGKRLNGIRVVRTNGSPVRFLTSAVRNVLRLVDFLPSFYFVGIVSILVTGKNQRIGDLAAGTMIIRERLAASPQVQAFETRPTAPAPPGSTWHSWDVGGVSAEELGAVKLFLERRHELEREARTQLAEELATGLRAKVPGADADLSPEAFLQRLAAVREQRGRA